MQAEPDNKVGFTRYLRAALASLYDPAVLRHSPLVGLFGVDQRDDPVSALRRILTDAIESLRPNKNTPPGSRTWRVYQILRRRYTEQLIQCKVASDLGLSIRQLQREEKLARETLANHLWTVHKLETRWRTLNKSQPALVEEHTSPTEESIPTRTQELEWLRDSVPVQMSDVRQVIRDVLETIGPLLAASSVSVEYAASENSPCIRLQAPILRQALLNVCLLYTSDAADE